MNSKWRKEAINMKMNIEKTVNKVVADTRPDYKDILFRNEEDLKEVVDDTVKVVNDIGIEIFSEISYRLGRWFW